MADSQYASEMRLGQEGYCAMRDSCGSKDWFGKPLPCPYDGPASEDDVDRDLLVSLCGAEYAEGPTCCTTAQLETLRDNIGLAENIISSCPACRNNFRQFWCTFTCSPDQATFLNVTSTQETQTGQEGVKSFGKGFYDSCKSIQMGATNGYAMDLIGGGAKNYSAFLKFMGDEKDMGSPFQINYPNEPPEGMTVFDATPRKCYDDDLSSRCACIDCPDVCQTLPDIPPPTPGMTCHVGAISCLSFVLVLAYGVAVASFILGYGLQLTIRRRKSYERVALSTDAASEHVSPRTHARGLVGASSLAQYVDGEESLGTQSDSRNLGRGASLLDPIETVQPRQYRLNNMLRRSFYRLGLITASYPFLSLCGSFIVIGALLSGWKQLQKEYFDEHFGPFYRPEQIFVTACLGAYLPSRRTYDVCFKPAGPDGFCVVQSCLPDFQQPLAPQYVLGGIPDGDDPKKYLASDALVVTYVEVQEKAMEWERALRDYLQRLSERAPSEAGLEEEINKSTNTDVKIVVLSYVAMFLGCVLLAIVNSLDEPTIFPRLPRKLFVGSKFSLGLFGILLVILSCMCSVGTFSFFGVKVTLIIAEVIPFLVLAVGVDNTELLHGPNAAAVTQGFGYGDAPMSPTQSRRACCEALAKMGPSILLSTITETLAFALGALVPMPAVRNFACMPQAVTVFVSALALDLKRVEASRVDCFPCIKLPTRIALEDPPTGSGLGMIARFIRRHYAPFLLKPVVKFVVLLTFLGICFSSIISMQHIQLGFDQRLALPSESYLVSYFDSVDSYLEIGPPVYFVVHDVDNICGRFTTCDDFSVANILEAERKRPQSSFIAEPAASWIDDYFNWLDPVHEKCCRVRKRNPDIFCRDTDSPRLCEMCYQDHDPAWNITMKGLPEDDEFMRYLRQWLISPTTEDCSLAGKASFGTALALSEDGSDVVASHFRTFHTPLKSQADFINSFAAARRIADDLSERTGMSIFPYSLHYVFFDQYAHIIAITEQILGLGLGAVLLVTALMLGSWRTGLIVTGVVALTVVSVMGVMGVWGIMLNAISLVNLVISLGIAVEFCAHVARAFMSAGSERDERMWTALVDVGPSVLSGITFTKLIGMCVLALTRSRFLEIYYFRMWITLIVSGALHGLILLPVVLSFAGGPGFPLEEADEEWMSHAIRHDYEYTPFLADDDSIASD
ncbi:patched family-domain-containing protein [Fomitopsis serialis]|uniref:patched family-domain-containing protein n=1 Tax=Fomitopsis serialis TaxID=139415 RepID=UPI002008C6C1|nr:patched family-domain-containing protein [Neoantrodia serialis]KAH9938246.1 patched family-domain-containing protein [Neoantrodia serialis]